MRQELANLEVAPPTSVSKATKIKGEPVHAASPLRQAQDTL